MLTDIKCFVAGDKRLFFGKPREAMTPIVSVAQGELRLATPVEIDGEPRDYGIVSYDRFGEVGETLRSFTLEDGGLVVRNVEFSGSSWGTPRRAPKEETR